MLVGVIYLSVHHMVMIRINIAEEKAHFSRYIEAVERGETVTVCRRNVPVAEIRALPQPRRDNAGFPLGIRDWRIAYLASVDSFEDSGGEVYLRIFSAPSENTFIADCREIAGIAGLPGRLLQGERQQGVYLWRRMLLKAQVEQLAKMSETLERSGFPRPQANAVIESVALAIEAFAVTPEILDDRIDGLRENMNAQFASQGEDIKDVRKSVNRLEEKVNGIEQNMLEFQRGTMRYMQAFLLLVLGAVVGMFGAIFSQLFVT